MKLNFKLFASATKIAWRNACLSLFKVPMAAIHCNLHFKNKSTQYIVICNHIGDFVLSLGYLNAFRKKNRFKHITLCITPKFVQLLSIFPQAYDDYIVFNEKKIELILSLTATNFGTHISKKTTNLTLINPTNAFTDELFNYIALFPNISFKDCIRYGCFKLDTESFFTRPTVNKCNFTHKLDGFLEGRTILISPWSRTTRLESNNIFVNLARCLKKVGYSIFTNLSEPNHKPISGTQGVCCTLEEAISFVETGGYIIGARSGLLDLLMYANCKVITIYSYNDVLSDFFNLHLLPETRASLFQIKQTLCMNKDIENIKLFIEGEILCP